MLRYVIYITKVLYMAKHTPDFAIGDLIGKLTVIGEAAYTREKNYICQCSCGEVVKRPKSYLRKKGYSCNKGSCKSLSITHGLTNTPLYEVWTGIKYRLKHPINNNKCYVGISMDAKWENDFKSFYDWGMANGYAAGLQIDRIDPLQGYTPENCRWVDAVVQSQNRGRHSTKSLDLPKGVFYSKPRNGKVIYQGTHKAPYYWIVIYKGKRHQQSGFTSPEEAYKSRCNFIDTHYKGKVLY